MDFKDVYYFTKLYAKYFGGVSLSAVTFKIEAWYGNEIVMLNVREREIVANQSVSTVVKYPKCQKLLLYIIDITQSNITWHFLHDAKYNANWLLIVFAKACIFQFDEPIAIPNQDQYITLFV